jgi:hypothetical protein
VDWIEGPYRFEVPISFDGDALGATKEVTIGSIAGFITLPSLPDGWLKRTYDDPWLDLKRPLLTLHQFEARYEQTRWGQPFEHPTGHSVIEAAVLRFEVDEALAQTNGAAVRRALRPWFRVVVRNWISAMTGQDLDTNGQPFRYIAPGPNAFSFGASARMRNPSGCETPTRRL